MIRQVTSVAGELSSCLKCRIVLEQFGFQQRLEIVRQVVLVVAAGNSYRDGFALQLHKSRQFAHQADFLLGRSKILRTGVRGRQQPDSQGCGKTQLRPQIHMTSFAAP